MKTLRMELGERSYDITVGSGALGELAKYMDLDRKVFIVTDTGVPREYAEAVKRQSRDGVIVTVPMGEGSKSPEMHTALLETMLELGMTRTDCAVAVGGGVVGDLTGYVAATYMRGIDFYNVPTTVLSEVDSSIGGKVAVNLGGVKNVIGAFHQPRAVVIDTDTLKTLPERQLSNGLAEAIKMAITSDRELFAFLEECDVTWENIEEIIVRSLMIKKQVVECDERESGIRKILNFGHTFGHAIEALEEMHGLYHGECVAIGMMPMLSAEARARVAPVLRKFGLSYIYGGDIEPALSYISHDKKCDGQSVTAVIVEEIGSYRLEKLTLEQLEDRIRCEIKKIYEENNL
jgi:3-dehydroquinate synthase